MGNSHYNDSKPFVETNSFSANPYKYESTIKERRRGRSTGSEPHNPNKRFNKNLKEIENRAVEVQNEIEIITSDGKKVPLKDLIGVELMGNDTTRSEKICKLQLAFDRIKFDTSMERTETDSDTGDLSDSCKLLNSSIMSILDPSKKSKWGLSGMLQKNNRSKLETVTLRRSNRKPAPVPHSSFNGYFVKRLKYPIRNTTPACVLPINGKKGKTGSKMTTPEKKAVKVKSPRRNTTPECVSPIKNEKEETEEMTGTMITTPKRKAVNLRSKKYVTSDSFVALRRSTRNPAPVVSPNKFNGYFLLSPRYKKKGRTIINLDSNGEDTKSTIMGETNKSPTTGTKKGASTIMELYQKKYYFKLLDAILERNLLDLHHVEENISLTKIIDGVEVAFMNIGPSTETFLVKNETDNVFFSVCKGSGVVNSLEKSVNVENGNKFMIPAGTVYNVANISFSPLFLLAMKSPNEDLTIGRYTLRSSCAYIRF